MNTQLIETQSLVNLKRIWRHYRKAIISLAVIGISSLFVWQYWQHHQKVRAEQASLLYQTLLEEGVNKQNAQTIDTQANVLINEYSDTPYAQLAALLLAKKAVDTQEWEAAESHLRFAAERFPAQAITPIAHLRLTKVLQERKEYAEALKLLSTAPRGYEAIYAEIQGDIYRAQGSYLQSKNAYEKSLKAASSTGASPLLQMKLNAVSILLQKTPQEN